jgi:hypothetical protein
VLVGTLAALLASVFLDEVASVPAAATGALVAVVLASFDRLFAPMPSVTSRQAGLALGAAAVCCTGAIAYLLSQVIG